MKKLHQNKYIALYYDADYDLFCYVPGKCLKDITLDAYIQELKVFIESVEMYHPRLFMGNFTNYNLKNIPGIQAWMDKNICRICEDLGFEKVAIVFPSHIIEDICMENKSFSPFQTAYFKCEKKAREWLVNG